MAAFLSTKVSCWCPSTEFTCLYENDGTVEACNGAVPNIFSNRTKMVEKLVLCGLHVDIVDLDNIMKIFPILENLTIVDSGVKRFKKGDLIQKTLKVLILVNVSITNEEAESIINGFQNLQILDLRNNSLTTMAKMVPLKYFPTVYLSGNPWNCSQNLDWALKLNQTVVRDLKDFKCSNFKYPGKPLLQIAKYQQELFQTCPDICECSIPYVVFNLKDETLVEPIIEVNCSEKGLTELPEQLPRHTKILRLERNYIEDLLPLRKNLAYRSVEDLYLDHNKISSIDVLEGSFWMNRFRLFSLKGNDLSDLPVYAMENAFQKNPNIPGARMYLGGNPWRCDCVFTPSFQEMLMKYQAEIIDQRDIKCSYVQGDENSMMEIVTLTKSSVCRQPSEYSIRALDLLNIVLASLIVLILGKLAFDYYYFKKTGRLPWIVTKMP